MSVGSAKPRLRWAVSVAPHAGGIHSFYRRFQAAAIAAGQSCISFEITGEEQNWASYDRTAQGPGHQFVTLDPENPVKAARAVVDWLDSHCINFLLVTPMSPWPVLDAVPHLPPHIRAVLRFTEISHYGYRRPLRTHGFDGLVTLCPRQEDDLNLLKLGHHIPKYRIPNCVNTEIFKVDPNPHRTLRLLVLDRMVHLQKRILFIPDLLEATERAMPDHVDWSMSVIGEGSDAAALDQKLKPWIDQGRVKRQGKVNHDDVPAIMNKHDIYLKLSTNEGSPNAVLEAMACGLVPVAADIPGVTDFVIEDGQSGRIVPADNMVAMAEAIVQLAGSPTLHRSMAQAARKRLELNFSQERFTERVALLATQLPQKSDREPRSWDDFQTCAPQHDRFWLRHIKKIVPLTTRKKLREIIRF